MSNEKMSFWNSIVIKSAMLFTTVIVVALFLLGYLINRQASGVISDYSQDQMLHASSLVKKSFYSMLNEVANDIALISKSPAIDDYVNNPSAENHSTLEKSFPIILSEKPNYFQIRLLDVDDDGKEIIKYEKVNEYVEKVSFDRLQHKGEKKYYKEAMAMDDESFYYSEISLNEEFGKISRPHIPTLRAIGKVFNQEDQLKTLLVINVDVSAFFEEVNQIGKQEIASLIIDDRGEYKYANDTIKRFGRQLGTGEAMTNDYDIVLKDFLLETNRNGVFLNRQKVPHLYHLDEMSYSDGLHRLYLITTASKEAVLANVAKVNRDSLLMVIIVCLFLLALIYLYTNFFSRKLSKITLAISDYEKGKVPSDHLTKIKKRKDEIGLLARSFSTMRKEIDFRVVELKESLKREKKAVAEKNEFLQNMSHELRTPLNAILGLTKLLHKNKPSSAQIPIIDSLQRSAGNLNGLMHDILDQQKLMEGRITLHRVATNVDEQLQTIVSSYRFDTIQKGLELSLTVSSELKEKYYLIDPLRFNQIVTNLLVNAIKYTASGQIDIQAGVLERERSHLTIDVRDTGRGIDPQNLLNIKERFFRVMNENTLRIDGFGLGLSIVKKLVDLFGGDLNVTSELGKGSIFNFSIPAEVAPPDSSPASEAVLSYPKLQATYHVLHIEDDISSQLMVKNTLEAVGIAVVQTNSMRQALQLLDNNHFELLLTDLMLDSELITKYVRQELSQYNIPIVITSAFDSSKHKDLNADYFQKPVDLNQLVDKIISVLGGNEYDVPQLKSTYEQYDHKKEKIVNYLKILDKEFDQYLLRFNRLSTSKDQKEWSAIKHKIATHINAMQLTRLKEALPERIEDLQPDTLDLLLNQVKFMLCYFRNELRINLAD
ncbi:ATP-binding protein [Fulvivirgaceae bacterium BMA12]|uniref:histidine kinase n=1 Tax=Agaribacillus aureus TaxID=3051825 RepID=A0ABT8LGN4_9BACT|nr:ATP-binding protein [Fulvivirgaceae bacterium BMA12]